MSLRTYKQIAITGALALGALGAVGCGDDAKKKETDAGSQGDGDGDAGVLPPMNDAGGGGPKSATCGGTVCEGQMLLGMFAVDACCAGQNQDKCGYLGSTFPPPANLDGCLERDAPGVASADVCGAFFDQVETAEGASKDDKLLLVKSDSGETKISLRFPGCCTAAGTCGAALSKPEGALGSALNLHLGCVPYDTLAGSLMSGDEPPDPSTLAILPFCNPETGGPRIAGTVPGAPTFICGCGEAAASPGADGLPCLPNTGTSVCGSEGSGSAIYTGALAMIPEFICGATGSNSALPTKLKNVDSTVCGTAPVADADSALLDAVPEFFCGAIGAPAGSNPAFLLPNVENSICGKLSITSDSSVLAEVPEFLCGAIDAPQGVSTALLLSNVEYSVCGKAPVTTDSAFLAAVPEFLCGAIDAPQGVSTALTLPNVEYAVCGKAPITSSSPELLAVPAFICGAVGAPEGSSPAMLLPNVEYSVCGKVPVGANSGLLDGVPEFLCGCGGAGQAPACLVNVDSDACGGAPINAAALAQLQPTLPETVCGCGAGVVKPAVAPGLPCLNNLDLNVCGPVAVEATDECVPGYPASFSGCGEDTTWSPLRSCIPNVADKPGCVTQ